MAEGDLVKAVMVRELKERFAAVLRPPEAFDIFQRSPFIVCTFST